MDGDPQHPARRSSMSISRRLSPSIRCRKFITQVEPSPHNPSAPIPAFQGKTNLLHSIFLRNDEKLRYCPAREKTDESGWATSTFWFRRRNCQFNPTEIWLKTPTYLLCLLGKCDPCGKVVPGWAGDGGRALCQTQQPQNHQTTPNNSSHESGVQPALGREIKPGLQSLGLWPQSNSLICFAEGQLLIFNYVSIFVP